jgi:hypothetical protein
VCTFPATALLQRAVGQIVDGLFSVLVTLGVVPIIRCPKGGAAEHVAAALEGKLRDHLKARSNLFSEGASALAATLSRPLLVLLDRNFDLSVMLQHCWSYKPLVQVSLQGFCGVPCLCACRTSCLQDRLQVGNGLHGGKCRVSCKEQQLLFLQQMTHCRFICIVQCLPAN